IIEHQVYRPSADSHYCSTVASPLWLACEGDWDVRDVLEALGVVTENLQNAFLRGAVDGLTLLLCGQLEFSLACRGEARGATILLGDPLLGSGLATLAGAVWHRLTRGAFRSADGAVVARLWVQAGGLDGDLLPICEVFCWVCGDLHTAVAFGLGAIAGLGGSRRARGLARCLAGRRFCGGGRRRLLFRSIVRACCQQGQAQC